MYPKYFSKDEEGGIGYKTWTLDGNDFNIMLFNFEGNVEIDQFIEFGVNYKELKEEIGLIGYRSQSCSLKNAQQSYLWKLNAHSVD